MTGIDLPQQFDRQLRTLLDKGYPQLGGVPEAEFLGHISPLRERLRDVPDCADLPFLIVVRSELVASHLAIERTKLGTRRGFTSMSGEDLAGFRPTGDLALPAGGAYLVTGIDLGSETRNVTPDAALPVISAAGRSPLTLDEGIALVTQHPAVLESGSRFSLLGSRSSDRRVLAVWVSAGRPRLGWCWAGAPHTWLGSASCASRVGAS